MTLYDRTQGRIEEIIATTAGNAGMAQAYANQAANAGLERTSDALDRAARAFETVRADLHEAYWTDFHGGPLGR